MLKPGGASVHVIPAKWQVIEPHIKVPFGRLQLLKRYTYYMLWAILGIRNEFQQGLSAREVAARNYHYSHTGLKYWSSRQYRQLFNTLPITWSWEEVAYMEPSYKPRIKRLAHLARRVPLIPAGIRILWVRILFLVKSASREEHTPPGCRNHASAAAAPVTVLQSSRRVQNAERE